MNRKTTKRALGLSFVSLLLCFTMLMGTTFAWFTDNATVAVNTIQAGTLDIKLLASNDESEVNEPTNSLENQTLKFVDENKNDMTGILFEPGARFNLQQVWLYNAGNLHAKYKVVISGIDGDEELAKVLDVYVNGQPTNKTLAELAMTANGVVKENTIAPKQFDTFGTITLKMQESAGNEYQGETIEGIAITVYATQAAVEYDSFNNTYDAGAEYDEPVNTSSKLKAAMEAGGTTILSENIALDEAVEVNKTTRIDLNGKTLTLDAAKPVSVEAGATLEIVNGKLVLPDSTATNAIMVNNDTEGTTTTLKLENITIEAGANDENEAVGIVAEAEAGDVLVNLGQNINITSKAMHSAPVLVGKNATVVMDGGKITAVQQGEPNSWTSLYGVALNDATAVFTMNGGTIEAAGENTASGICANAGTVNLNGGVIDVTAGNTKYGYSIGIEAYNATLNLNGGTINVMSPGAYDAEALDVTSKTIINYEAATSTFAVNLYKSIWSGNRVSEDASVNTIITGVEK